MRAAKFLNQLLGPLTIFSRRVQTPKSVLRVGGFLASVALFYKLQEQMCPALQCFEDKNTSTARRKFSSAISEMRRQYGQLTVYPEIKVSTQGSTYVIEFEVDQRKVDGIDVMSAFLETFKTSTDFTINGGSSLKENDLMTFNLTFEEKEQKFKTRHKGSVTITMVKDGDRPNSRFIVEKDEELTNEDLRAIIRAYKETIMPREEGRKPSFRQSEARSQGVPSPKPQNQNVKKLTQLGAIVFDPSERISNLDWQYLAGYQKQKRDIEDTVLLALTHSDIYDKITEGTRMVNQANRPKAVLFQGPPGTGKTTSAKIIAQQVNIPLIYIPLEAVMSKFFGESEKRLADLWQACSGLGRAIIFIDQIDALAGNRGSDMHEASRRILSTLLRKIDSFQSTTDVLLICATNRKGDIDPAMLSRIDLSIKFDLPDKLSRAAIFKRYAKQLSDAERQKLSEVSEGFSGRNISDVCKNAERRWASKLIRNQVKTTLPGMEEYIQSLNQRKDNQLDAFM